MIFLRLNKGLKQFPIKGIPAWPEKSIIFHRDCDLCTDSNSHASLAYPEEVDDFMAAKFQLVLRAGERTHAKPRRFVCRTFYRPARGKLFNVMGKQSTSSYQTPGNWPSFIARHHIAWLLSQLLKYRPSVQRDVVFKQPVGRFQRRATGNQAR